MRVVAVAAVALVAADLGGCRRAAMNRTVEPQALVSHEELNESDSARFVRATGLAVTAELEMSRLAAQRARSPALRAASEGMLADHTRMYDELGELAREMGIPLPAVIPDESGRVATLATASPERFDTEFVRDAGVAHRALESLLEGHAAAGPEPQLRAFAARWLVDERAHRGVLDRILPGS